MNFTSDQNPTPLELPLIKDELIDLVNHAMKSIDVAEFYFTLKCSDVFNKTLPTCQAGEKLLQSMIHAASSGIQVRIAVNGVREKDMNEDLVQLESAGAQIRFVDFTSLVGSFWNQICLMRSRSINRLADNADQFCFSGAGVLHTKMMIFDDDKFFLGSANMDWRSLTQVKEIGELGKSFD